MAKFLEGGYAQIDLTSTTLYNDIYKALQTNKMVICYLGNNLPFIADNIVYDDDNDTYTISNGNTIYTITNQNVLTTTDNTPHLYLYSIDLTDGDTEDGITFPNGGYITLLTSEQFDTTETTPNGEYIVMQGLYASGADQLIIFKIKIENGDIIVIQDSSGMNSQLVSSYEGLPTLLKQIF